MNAELLLTALDALPIEIIPANTYRNKMDTARKQIGQRDPDDVDLLALALAENIPVWSEDKDFESADVEHFTTAKILKNLG